MYVRPYHKACEKCVYYNSEIGECRLSTEILSNLECCPIGCWDSEYPEEE